MWYVDILVSVQTNERIRYEGLTQQQARDIHRQVYPKCYAMVRSGPMR